MEQAERDAMILDFARETQHSGWSDHAFASFCDRRGVERWVAVPGGVRALAWRLNAMADEIMAASFGQDGQALSAIMLRRFATNRELKGAVRALACSDALHPHDTLKRTAQTAKLMWRGVAGAEPTSHLRIWALVLVYSGCVLLWLADRTADQRITRRAVRLGAALLGQS